jgi:SAM-dependent methyltransferase
MIERPDCPICGNATWERLSSHAYGRSDRGLSASTRARYDVLFDLWLPGKEQVTITFQLCRRCGFVLYTPRPTAEEISLKYAKLGGATSSTARGPVATKVDRTRSRELAHTLQPYTHRDARVLDFGGGTGSLMVCLVEQGIQCSVVDYAAETISGVERAATQLSELPTERRFDLIVVSHVLEHLADPLTVTRALQERLTPEGVLYVEVPLELVGGAPRRREPVTHINFFAEPSLLELLERARFDVLRCWTAATTHSGGQPELSVCALARPVSESSAATPSGAPRNDVSEVERLLRMGVFAKARNLARHPRLLLKPFKRWQARRRGRRAAKGRSVFEHS